MREVRGGGLNNEVGEPSSAEAASPTSKAGGAANLGPDFSLLCPRALHTLTRKDPPVKLRVPPASAAAATKAMMEMEEKMTRERGAGWALAAQRQRRASESAGGIRNQTLELRGGQLDGGDDDGDAMMEQAVPEPTPKKRKKKKKMGGAAGTRQVPGDDDNEPILGRTGAGVAKQSKAAAQHQERQAAALAAAKAAQQNSQMGQQQTMAGMFPPGMAAAVSQLQQQQQLQQAGNVVSQAQQLQRMAALESQRRQELALVQQQQQQQQRRQGLPQSNMSSSQQQQQQHQQQLGGEAAEVARQRAEIQAALAQRQQAVQAMAQQGGGGGGGGQQQQSQGTTSMEEDSARATAIAALMSAAQQGSGGSGSGGQQQQQQQEQQQQATTDNSAPPPPPSMNGSIPMPGDKRGSVKRALAAADGDPSAPSPTTIEAEDRLTAIPPSSVMELSQHTSEVFMCAWNPRFTHLIATGSGDASARIWQINGPDASGGCGASILLPHGHDSSDKKNKDVTTLEWSSDGELLATGSYDGVARVWSKTGELKQTLKGHRGPIFSLKWNRRGNFLLSGSYDKSTIVWDVTGEVGFVKQQFSYHFAPALDVDWKDDLTFASCSTDKTVQICRVGLARPIKTTPDTPTRSMPSSGIRPGRYSPPARTIAPPRFGISTPPGTSPSGISSLTSRRYTPSSGVLPDRVRRIPTSC